MTRKFSNHKRRREEANTKILSGINVGQNIREERITLGNSGGTISLSDDSKMAMSQLEDKIDQKQKARINFFENFFSENNEFKMAKIILISPSECSIVNFSLGNNTPDESLDNNNNSLNEEEYKKQLEYFKSPWGTRLGDYINSLYVMGIREVQYIENIPYDKLAICLKSIMAFKGLEIIALGESAMILDSNQNILYWDLDGVPASVRPEVLEVAVSEYRRMIEDVTNIPDLEGTFKFFQEEPLPNMKMKKIKEASDNWLL